MSQIAQILSTSFFERVGADAVFAPSFDDLLASGEPELMRGAVCRWLARGNRAGARDVYQTWLKAGGEPELIRESLLGWLADNAATSNSASSNAASSNAASSNATAEEASFVYSAWLEAGGEAQLVRDALGAWFELHGERPAAGFLYRAWLSAGGELQVFSGRICDWLAAHTNDEGEAHNLYCAWLDNGGEPVL